MPSFIAATEPLPAAQTIERNVRGFFSFFSCSYKKRTRFSPLQRRRYVLFSAGRKDTKRAVEATASNSHPSAEKRIHTGSQQTEPRTCVRSPSFAVRELSAAGKPAPAGARRAPCERPPARCLRKGRRLTDHASFASVDAVFYSRHRTIAGCTNDRTLRSRLLFVLFLYGQEKNTFLLYQRRRICTFLRREKRYQKSC